MGDPRKLRNKFERPQKLWDMDRITEEKTLKTTYGLRNMRELWMLTAQLKKYRRVARQLLSISADDRAKKEKQLLAKLLRLGVLKESSSSLADVLSFEVKDLLERRLQTIVLRMGLARSMSQSRQLITHGFISINGVKNSRPGTLIHLGESVAHGRQIDISTKANSAVAPVAPVVPVVSVVSAITQ